MSKSEKPEVVVGKVYAEWCGHCQLLAPEWDKMKISVNKKCEKYNCEKPKYVEIEDSELSKLEDFNKEYEKETGGSKVESSGYPTIFKVYGGKVEYYSGERNADKMENWFMNEVYKKNSVPTTVLGGKRQKLTNKKRKNKRKITNKRKTMNKRK